MKGEIFKGIKQWEISIKGGEYSGKIPIFYYDNTALHAIFTASTEKVRKYLPHPNMHPVEFSPGRCLVGFSAFEYRDTDIGPYNEFSISIIINWGKKSIPVFGVLKSMFVRTYSAYIWHLPVTTEIAYYGGVELYGYPKFIADIEFIKEKDYTICRLSEKGKHILTLRGKNLSTRKEKFIKYRTYPIKDGIPLLANVLVDPIEYAQSLRGDNATIEIGDSHPICEELRGIELSKSPVLYQYIPLNQTILFGPRNIIDD